jgi:hypothetical protein
MAPDLWDTPHSLFSPSSCYIQIFSSTFYSNTLDIFVTRFVIHILFLLEIYWVIHILRLGVCFLYDTTSEGDFKNEHSYILSLIL